MILCWVFFELRFLFLCIDLVRDDVSGDAAEGGLATEVALQRCCRPEVRGAGLKALQPRRRMLSLSCRAAQVRMDMQPSML